MSPASSALVSLLACGLAMGVASTADAQDSASQGEFGEDVAVAPPEDLASTALPEAPEGTREAPSGDARSLADPLALDLRASELDALLAADARAAEQARTFGAAMGYVIGALGLGATPVFFALDDGSGLFPILSILPLQLGALSLASAILGSVMISTEERRHQGWSALRAVGRPGLAEIARHEGYLVADADRARDARLFSLAQGTASIVTGLFTGIVGLAASRVELTQITLGALGAVEILVGALQLISALEAGDVEARPAQYEARTGVRLTVNAMGLSGSF